MANATALVERNGAQPDPACAAQDLQVDIFRCDAMRCVWRLEVFDIPREDGRANTGLTRCGAALRRVGVDDFVMLFLTR